MCGTTTGGRQECWWDCQVQVIEGLWRPGEYRSYLENIDCLEDCFTPGHCLRSLLDDLRSAGGICKDSFINIVYPDWLPVSNKSCEVDQGFFLKKGLCSQKTENLLRNQKNCIHPLWSSKTEIFRSINSLIWSLCTGDTFLEFNTPTPLERNKKHKGRFLKKS